DPRIGQREPLLGFAGREQQSGHAGGLTYTNGYDIVLYVLHGVVNGHPRSNRTARRIDVELDIFFRIFLRKEEHLGNHQVSYVVIDGRADENNVVPKQAGVNVVGPLASPGLFDDHRYQHCLWSFLCASTLLPELLNWPSGGRIERPASGGLVIQKIE